MFNEIYIYIYMLICQMMQEALDNSADVRAAVVYGWMSSTVCAKQTRSGTPLVRSL